MPKKFKPPNLIKKGGELNLSNEEFMDLAQAVLGKGVPLRFSVKGFSMSPFIREKDVVTLCPFGNRAVSCGDVVGFVEPDSNKFLIHRIIMRTKSSYLIKGDNIVEPDGCVHRKHLLGIVTKVERNGKKIRLGLGTESRLIAFLSRMKLFPQFFLILKRFFFSFPCQDKNE